jgi:N-acyl-D-aspartate/D-glutamate deacylase
MQEILVRGGFLVDGTGGPGRTADVRVAGGKIVEVGPDLPARGEQVIDAAGAIVAPGFIDSHTHYDAAIFWDPLCDPMPQHGVTTVVIGNCSLGLAPMRPDDRAGHIDVFSYIEDIPRDTLASAIPWDWQSFPEYARALAGEQLGVDVAAFVGHSQIRSFVMGPAAWERVATYQEIVAMVAELDRALGAGAIGLSFSLFDKDRQGRPVPSCRADDAEMDALCAVLARHKAVFQFVPRGDTTEALLEDLRRIGGWIGPHGIVALYNIVVHVDVDPERSGRVTDCLEAMQAEGIRIYGMASPRPFENAIGFDGGISFLSLPAWNELVQAPLTEKRRLASDPAWRARARDQAGSLPSVMFPFANPEKLRIGTVANAGLESWAGRTLADLARERDGNVSDVLADWLIENDFDTTFIFAIANTDPKDVVRLLNHPHTFVSGSDAGAHLLMFAAVGDPTLLLTRYVRDRGDLGLEEVIHALTRRQAELLGLDDRGVIRPGMAADLVIFALEELDYGDPYLVDDVPGGQSRMTRRPGGYRLTIVNGEPVQANGTPTGKLPARFLARAG